MKQYKTLTVASLSLIALVGGMLAIAVVLDFMTAEAAYDLGSKVLAVGAIIVIVTVVLIEVLKFNQKD